MSAERRLTARSRVRPGRVVIYLREAQLPESGGSEVRQRDVPGAVAIDMENAVRLAHARGSRYPASKRRQATKWGIVVSIFLRPQWRPRSVSRLDTKQIVALKIGCHTKAGPVKFTVTKNRRVKF